jgi:hypothetical protein
VGHGSTSDGKYQLAIRPIRLGKYKIYLYCNEMVVPSAYPLLAIAETTPPSTLSRRSPSAGGTRKAISSADLGRVVLRGDGLQRAPVNESAEFIIDCSEVPTDAMGKCVAALTGDRADIPIKLTPMRNQASHFNSQKGQNNSPKLKSKAFA